MPTSSDTPVATTNAAPLADEAVGPGARILVTGAAGFIGSHVVAALLEAGHRVRVFVRRADYVAPAAEVEVATGHMNDTVAVAAACAGCDGVIHLAAQTRDAPDSDAVNVGGAQCLIDACRAAGCRRIIVVSTQSAKILVQGDYGRTKAAADALFLASGLDVTVFLPSVVYGSADDGIFGTLRRVVSGHRVVPVLGDGRWRSAPVHVADVASVLVRALAVPASIGKRYDLGGPDEISFDRLLDRIAGALHRPAPIKLHVPLVLSLAIAGLLARVMKAPPISRSNVLGSNQDTGIDIGPARSDLGFDPIPLAEGLARVFPAPDDRLALEREARMLADYLLDVTITADTAMRYATAHRQLLPANPDSVTAFARRHPWSLAALDAASAWRGTAPPLRQRVLLMATVLEATPEFADRFLPAPRHVSTTLAVLAWHGLRALALAALGAPLCWWLRDKTTDA